MPGTFVMPKAFLGYEAGAVLRDVPLAEARSWECNRCGDCCDSSREDVKKDPASGMPLLVWESAERAADPKRSKTADPDRYADRYGGRRLIQPIVMLDGELGIGKDFDLNDGKPHTSFRCAALQEYPDGPDGPESGCAIMGNPGPYDGSQRRPEQCGSFPVFGVIVDSAIIGSGSYVPPTGALPRCTWHGIRLVGPWKPTAYWRDRYQKQVLGLPVDPVGSFPPEFAAGLLRKNAGRDL